jgi:hypothetical protein
LALIKPDRWKLSADKNQVSRGIMLAGKLLRTPLSFKRLLIPVFCLTHMMAIFWWTLPHSFGTLELGEAGGSGFEAKLFKWLAFDDNTTVNSVLTFYIDVTGNQQYWDFFGPFSPKSHQYLSICAAITRDPGQEKITCQNEPLFSNLDVSLNDDNSDIFKPFGSDRSRFYRLTENLINLDEPFFLKAFTEYYRINRSDKRATPSQAYLVLHQFELHPDLKDLPKSGYRMDKVLMTIP